MLLYVPINCSLNKAKEREGKGREGIEVSVRRREEEEQKDGRRVKERKAKEGKRRGMEGEK